MVLFDSNIKNTGIFAEIYFYIELLKRCTVLATFLLQLKKFLGIIVVLIKLVNILRL